MTSFWNETANVFRTSGYAVFSVEAHIVCTIILAVLFNRQQNSSDQTESSITWSRLLFIQILYCLSGIVMVLTDVNISPHSETAMYIVTALNLGLFGLNCYMVFLYILQSQKFTLSFAKVLLASLPFMINVIILAVSPFIGRGIDVSGGVMETGVLFPLMMFIDLGYPVAGVVISFWAGRGKIYYGGNTVSLMMVYPAFFTVCGTLQAMNWRMPVLCYAIILADVLVYVSYADSLVSVDPLTKIPNRNALMKVLAERLGKENPEVLHVFAVDIDDLAAINSSHGRQEGDRVLVVTAGALMNFKKNEHKCYASRYYSDEFMIAADINDAEERELFIEHIRNYISNAAMSKKLNCHIRVSIGWAKYEPYSRTETISGLLEEADRSMTESKEQKKFQTMWNAAM